MKEKDNTSWEILAILYHKQRIKFFNIKVFLKIKKG